MSALRLVHARQVACWPWGLAWLDAKSVHFATCRTCERDVAQPNDRCADVPVCLYCGLDSGLVPAIELPLGDQP